MNKAWKSVGCAVTIIGAFASSISVSNAADSNQTVVRLLSQSTLKPVANAVVYVGDKEYPVDSAGRARIKHADDRVTLTAAYWDGNTRRIETIHDFSPTDGAEIHVPHKGDIERKAVFSLGVPFGPIQREAKALLLLPQLAYESGGLNFGHYMNVRLYSDQIQNDGLFTLMVVALDEKLIPAKYGYMLDASPDGLDGSHSVFLPPLATDIDKDVQLVKWKKRADPISASAAGESCAFKAPPYTECGLPPDQGGMFSWVNVWRKGELFHTPGAFLPPRTAGANPLMALPDSQIEVVGHDDPKGFAPFNYARHRFLRYEVAPEKTIEFMMPNIVIGDLEKPGAEAITLDATKHEASFEIRAVGDNDESSNVDFGMLQAIWTQGDDGPRTIWNQYFAPTLGKNRVALAAAPRTLASWLPESAQEKYENVQVWLYGSDGIGSYAEAVNSHVQGASPVQQGKNAFQVTRWR